MEPFLSYDFPRPLSTKCLKKVTFQTLSRPATLRNERPGQAGLPHRALMSAQGHATPKPWRPGRKKAGPAPPNMRPCQGRRGLFPFLPQKTGKGRFFPKKQGRYIKKRGPARVFADGPNKERGTRRRVPDHPGEGRPRCFLYTPCAVQVTFQTLSELQYCESFLLTSSDPWGFSVKKRPFLPFLPPEAPSPLQGSNCLFMPSRL